MQTALPRYALITYATGSTPRVGVVVGGSVVDLARTSGHSADVDMIAVLADWPIASTRIVGVAQKLSEGQAEAMPLTDVQLLSPLPLPTTVFCAGANYRDHVLEMARVAGTEPDPDPRAAGLHSWHFIKSSRSVIGPGAAIEIPVGSQKLDWEVELVAVIGREGKNIPVSRALDHLAGYSIAIDLSARDLSRRNGVSPQSPFRFDWVAHKSFDTACPIGPWIVPSSAISDPQSLAISLAINGVTKQDSNTSEMIFSVAEQISDLSRNLTLRPGDIILTGTPAGVGSAEGRFLQPGDQIVARIEDIGELPVTVR